MDLTILIIIILFIIAAVLAFKLIKSAIISLILVFFTAAVLIALTGILVYQDMTDLKENFSNSDQLILLDSNNAITAGVKTYADGTAEPIKDKDELPTYPVKRSEKYYKTIIIKIELLITSLKTEEISIDQHIISKKEAESLLRSDNAKEELISLLTKKEGPENSEEITQEIEAKTETEIKSSIFELAFDTLRKEKGEGFETYLMQEYKKGNVKIIPETATFKIIKIIPNFLINKIKLFKGEQ